MKIRDTFPAVFNAEEILPTFLSAKSKVLTHVKAVDLGYDSWNGEAVIALAGQGCLYLSSRS